MESKKPIGRDFGGYEVLTEAVKVLLNEFPGLLPKESIGFEDLKKGSGIAFSADNGALIYTEKEDVCGGVVQLCRYPFFVIYRTSTDSERQKLMIQKFLDALGKWLCKETSVIDGESHKLVAYPKLASGRTIKKITRDNFYGLEPDESGVQDWVLPGVIEYENEFER